MELIAGATPYALAIVSANIHYAGFRTETANIKQNGSFLH